MGSYLVKENLIRPNLTDKHILNILKTNLTGEKNIVADIQIKICL